MKDELIKGGMLVLSTMMLGLSGNRNVIHIVMHVFSAPGLMPFTDALNVERRTRDL